MYHVHLAAPARQPAWAKASPCASGAIRSDPCQWWKRLDHCCTSAHQLQWVSSSYSKYAPVAGTKLTNVCVHDMEPTNPLATATNTARSIILSHCATCIPTGLNALTYVEGFWFNIGNAIKYLWRVLAKFRTRTSLEDLRKAVVRDGTNNWQGRIRPDQSSCPYNVHPNGIECIDVVEGFGFNIGNAIKYLWRAGLKPDTDSLDDLRKAMVRGPRD